MPISEGKGLTYRTNARYRKYRDKKKGFKDAHISGIDKGPRVIAFLERTKTEALIDTGASVSIISKRLLDRIRTKRKIKIEPWTHAALRVADRRTLDPIGFAQLAVRIGYKTQNHTFVIIDWESYGLILGCDFIHRTRMDLSVWRKRVTFGTDPRRISLLTDPIPDIVASISLFSLDAVTLPPMSQTTIDCVTAKSSSLATGVHEGWITTHNLPANRRGLFAEKGYQILGEGKTRIAISNLTNETRTIHPGQTVARFQKETQDNEEVLVVNNLSLEEDLGCPLPDADLPRNVDRESGTDELSLEGTAESVVNKRSCTENRAEKARPRNPGLGRQRPSCEYPRKAAGPVRGRNLTVSVGSLIDDTTSRGRDVSTVEAPNLESTDPGYEYGDRRCIQRISVPSTGSREPREKKYNHARKRKRSLAAVAHEKETDPLHEIDLTDSGLTKPQKAELTALLEEFRDIFAKNPKRPGRTNQVRHEIDTGSNRPINVAPYRLGPVEKQKVAEEIKVMQENDIIRPSRSPWAAPVVLVTKKDGTIRFCVDYRKINAITKKDVYPLPRIDEALDAMHGATLFSTLDLASGYWQVEMDPQDREKTAFISDQGLFEFNVMPFGLCNAPATFQRLMDAVLAGLKWTTCLVYLDDIIIFSKTFPEHLERLRGVFERIREAKLELKATKCHFARRDIAYLGHVVSEKGIAPDPAKVRAVQDFPTPTTVKDLRSFLGLTSYYRRFVKNYAKISYPLYRLLEKNASFDWSVECQTAFAKLKTALTTKPILHTPDFTKTFKLQTDASDRGLGVVLSQNFDGREYPIAYASRTLSPGELKWDTREKEALAIIWGCEHFRPYLIGKPFMVETDHSSLKWLMNVPKGRLSRWALRLSEYDFEIRHKAGVTHGNADGVSRVPLPHNPADDIYDDDMPHVYTLGFQYNNHLQLQLLQHEQERDANTKPIIDYLTSGKLPEDTRLKNKLLKPTQPFILDRGILKRKIRIRRGSRLCDRLATYIPASMKDGILQQSHNDPLAGHVGFTKTYQKLRELFHWKGMKRDAHQYIKGCLACQSRKPSEPTGHGLLKHLPIPEQPFDIVDIDFLGPFPKTANENTYILIAIDRLTGFPIAAPTKDATAKSAADAVYSAVICEYGVPRVIHSDKGTHFIGNVFKRLCERMNVQQEYTTTKHPQANALPERFNRFLNKCLSIFSDEETQKDWDQWLQPILFAYRTSVHPAYNDTPFYLLHGFDATQPLEIEYGPERKFAADTHAYGLENTRRTREARHATIRLAAEEREKHKHRYDERHVQLELHEGDLALLWNPLEPIGERKGLATKLMIKYLGPFRVVRKVSDVNYEIRDLHTGKTRLVHVQRLRPFSPWRLSHVDEIDTPTNEVPLDSHSFRPTDFTGRRRRRALEENAQGPTVKRQKIEVYVDIPTKTPDKAPQDLSD
jgi:transposase InsO family protein